MSTWDLEPGCERIIPRGEPIVAMNGIGNLTPQEAADRAERWFGARVDYRSTGKIKIYPKDTGQPMVVISDRWLNGNDRRNAVSRLQRVGLDVLNGQTPPDSQIRSDGRSIDPHLTQNIVIPERTPDVTTPKPTAVPPKPSANGSKPGGTDYESLLAMLVEAERSDQARRTEITQLGRTVDGLIQRLERMELSAAQNRASMARVHKAIKDSEARILAGGSLPVDEARRAEQERAEITTKALQLLAALPSAATMSAGSIAASLGMEEQGNLTGKLLATAAKEEKVQLVKVGTQKLYRAMKEPTA